MKYLLKEEQTLINSLIKDLNILLKKDLTNIEKSFYNLIKNTKDFSILDTIAYYNLLLDKEISTILNKKITPSIQYGIKNNTFTIYNYHGHYNINSTSPNIDENTYFSFDSISKFLTAINTLKIINKNNISLTDTVNSYNSNFNTDSTIESILKFTAHLQTNKRIDNLSREETISILKICKENLELKQQYKNYYQYNDIGYMILRLSLPNFLEELDLLIQEIDSLNLTYKNYLNKDNITGGRINQEYITPDPKGKDILYPGHTGLYGNIQGLINLFEKTIIENNILNTKEKELLFKQPYSDPKVYDINNKPTSKYIAKIAGIYRKPNNITDPNYNKLSSCDMSNLTTNNAIASTGTCGSWIIVDNLSKSNNFNYYLGGILTNPYSSIENNTYPKKENNIPNTNLIVNQKGKIIGYQKELDPYKELITEYGLLLELLTAYLKNSTNDIKKYKLINGKRTS